VHSAFLKQVKVVEELASDPIPKNIKRYQGIERFSKQSDFQFQLDAQPKLHDEVLRSRRESPE
jgi:hypothetical protein